MWILLKREKELMHDNLVYYVLVLDNVINNGLKQLLLLLYVLFFSLDIDNNYYYKTIETAVL